MYSDMNPCPDPDLGVDVAGAIEWMSPKNKELGVCEERIPSLFSAFLFFFLYFISAIVKSILCGHSFLSF